MTAQLKFGVLALLEAQSGKEDELAAFLESGRELAVAEPGTVTWYAFRAGDSTFGIFDTFETEEARQAHMEGEIPRALGQVAEDLLAGAPDIRMIDVIAAKQRGRILGPPNSVTCGGSRPDSPISATTTTRTSS
jgi:quinol monooxygenase YgiN